MILLILSSLNETNAQRNFRGRVIYKKDARPAARVSVGLKNRPQGSVTDESGNFSINLSGPNSRDTLVISSVGYENIIIPVREAVQGGKFELKEFSRNLPNVTVKSFTSEGVVGATRESVGFFRSWNYDSTGGEIGRIFKLPYSEYKIDRVRFKISNLCNSCLLRLHIREVVDGEPGDELFSDSISLTVKGATLDGKAPEFNLTNYDMVFDQKEIFVGIEAIGCKPTPGKKDCSLCFAGTELGAYSYRSTRHSSWEKMDDFAIYMKLFMRY